MRKTAIPSVILASLIAPALSAAPARAAGAKTWVANNGIDGPSCGAAATPCRTFQQAHNNVAAGGEVGVLIPGDYGQFAIGKSVNITNDGTGEAGVAAPAFLVAVQISAGVGDIVSLRGLVIDGQGQGERGIQISGATAVHIQNCVIKNFEAAGDGFGITLAVAGASQLFVSDTIIYNNGSNAGSAGIWIVPIGSGSANVVLDRVHLENNISGLRVDGSFSSGNGNRVIVRDSVLSGNAADGIDAITTAGHAETFVVVERSSVVNNAGTGILASGSRVTALLDDDTVARNATGISAVNGGQLISYGNNRINNNTGPDGMPTGSYRPL